MIKNVLISEKYLDVFSVSDYKSEYNPNLNSNYTNKNKQIKIINIANYIVDRTM